MPIIKDGQATFIVPSATLIQNTLDAIPGEKITLAPRFNIDSFETLDALHRQQQHPLGLSYPLGDFERITADNNETGRLGFSLHDVYHAFLLKGNPFTHSVVSFIDLVKNPDPQTQSQSAEAYKKLYNLIIDSEHQLLQSHIHHGKPVDFNTYLHELIIKSINLCLLSAHNKYVNDNNISDISTLKAIWIEIIHACFIHSEIRELVSFDAVFEKITKLQHPLTITDNLLIDKNELRKHCIDIFRDAFINNPKIPEAQRCKMILDNIKICLQQGNTNKLEETLYQPNFPISIQTLRDYPITDSGENILTYALNLWESANKGDETAQKNAKNMVLKVCKVFHYDLSVDPRLKEINLPIPSILDACSDINSLKQIPDTELRESLKIDQNRLQVAMSILYQIANFKPQLYPDNVLSYEYMDKLATASIYNNHHIKNDTINLLKYLTQAGFDINEPFPVENYLSSQATRVEYLSLWQMLRGIHLEPEMNTAQSQDLSSNKPIPGVEVSITTIDIMNLLDLGADPTQIGADGKHPLLIMMDAYRSEINAKPSISPAYVSSIIYKAPNLIYQQDEFHQTAIAVAKSIEYPLTDSYMDDSHANDLSKKQPTKTQSRSLKSSYIPSFSLDLLIASSLLALVLFACIAIAITGIITAQPLLLVISDAMVVGGIIGAATPSFFKQSKRIWENRQKILADISVIPHLNSEFCHSRPR
jgi:hypothetical protein